MAKVLLVEDNTDRITQIIKPHNGRGGLYLGSQKAACDTNLLKSLSIQAVITVAAELDNKYPKDVEHLKIIIEDQPLAYIYEHFQLTSEFLKKNLQNGNVFVHCRMGISRSASIVIAYIMRTYKYPYLKAYAKVKAKRSIINPNEGFVMQMKSYEKKINESLLQKKDK